MDYHTIDGTVYWDESAYYSFTDTEIDRLELVTDQLHKLCIKAVEHVIKHNLFPALRIPGEFTELIIRSWEMDEPALYGRFDLVYDGENDPKLLEYNADTPTALFEASVVQWFWLKDRFPEADQFNSIHEKLMEFWKNWPHIELAMVHFASVRENPEDLGNIEYIRDTAMQSGLDTAWVAMEDIGWAPSLGKLVDLEERPIHSLFKLYPWEWMIREDFGRHLKHAASRLIEPAWKMILSNKGILPILWELFEGHPNLLPAYFEHDRLKGEYVQKPIYSREGGNVTIVRGSGSITSPGTYGAEGYIYQQYCGLPLFDGNYPVIGAWVINNTSAGIGIREDTTEITTNGSRFIPHIFTEG